MVASLAVCGVACRCRGAIGAAPGVFGREVDAFGGELVLGGIPVPLRCRRRCSGARGGGGEWASGAASERASERVEELGLAEKWE